VEFNQKFMGVPTFYDNGYFASILAYWVLKLI
jgi:hypothetical protein